MSPSLGTADAGKVRLARCRRRSATAERARFGSALMSPSLGTADAGKFGWRDVAVARHAMRARFGSARCRRRSAPPNAGKVRLGAMSPSLSTADAARFGSAPCRRRSAPLMRARFASARCRRRFRLRNNPRPTGLADNIGFSGMSPRAGSLTSAPERFHRGEVTMSTQATVEVPSSPIKLVTFHRLIPDARLPQRADRSAAGMLPTRAYRYMRAGHDRVGLRYYIFPAWIFQFRFDGYMAVDLQGVNEWQPIPKSATCNTPDSEIHFASVAPSECADYAPPLLGVLELPGTCRSGRASLPAPRQAGACLSGRR